MYQNTRTQQQHAQHFHDLAAPSPRRVEGGATNPGGFRLEERPIGDMLTSLLFAYTVTMESGMDSDIELLRVETVGEYQVENGTANGFCFSWCRGDSSSFPVGPSSIVPRAHWASFYIIPNHPTQQHAHQLYTLDMSSTHLLRPTTLPCAPTTVDWCASNGNDVTR